MTEDCEMAYRGISRLELELLVREFIEVLCSGDVSQIAPFLHRDIQLTGMTGSCVVGSRAVMRLWGELLADSANFSIRVVTIASVDHTVLVEQSLSRCGSTNCREHRLLAFAAFEIEDFQIISWRQVSV